MDNHSPECYREDNIAEETRVNPDPVARSVMPMETRSLYDNLPDLIPVELAAEVLDISVKTLYDWKYRGQVRETRIPPDLFAKLGGKLYLRKETLNRWVQCQNSSFNFKRRSLCP